MANIKFSEFQKATQSKDTDELAILQDGVNKMIQTPILESKIINKTVSRVIDQGGASLNIINPIGVVPTYADLSSLTPNLNDAYQVESDGLVYVYTETGFQSEGGGFIVQPEPIGVVEEGNTQAVSGGEVEKYYKPIVKRVAGDKFLDFTLIGADINPVNGNVNPNQIWLVTDKIDVSNLAGTTLTIYGYGTNPTVYTSFLYKYGVGGFLGVTGNGGQDIFNYTVEEGVTNIAIRVEGGAGVAVNPSESPFNNSFKIKYTALNQLIINTDAIVDDINSDQLIRIESSLANLNKEAIPFEYPESFPNKSIKIHRVGNDYFPTDFKSIKELYEDVDLQPLVYVNPITGSNTNNGSEASPFMSINGAIAQGNNNIKLQNIGGFYPRAYNIADLIIPTEFVNFKISADDGVIMANSRNSSNFEFTNEGGNVFKTSINIVSNVLRVGSSISSIKKVDSMDELSSLDYGFYFNGSELYIKSIDGVSDNFEICQLALQRITCNGLSNLILENIKFMGSQGDAAILVQSPTNQCENVYLFNIEGSNNILGGGIGVRNVKNCYVESCSGFNNLRDSIAYSKSMNLSGTMSIFEYKCFGANGGINSTEQSSNGSTIHDGCDIVRIGCRYNNFRGPIVADVNDGAKSINMNVVATNTVLPGGAGFQIHGVGSEMWLHACGSESEIQSNLSIRSYAGATCYLGWGNRLINGVEGNIKNVF